MFKLGKAAYIGVACALVVLGAVGYGIYVLVTRNNNASEAQITGLLYPSESETREVISLDGLWDFAMSDPYNPSEGLQKQWFTEELQNYVNITKTPVPSSYNDLDVFEKTRDHVGTVWYERKFFVSPKWNTQRVWLRFGSVHYDANVWINGQHVIQHSFGHLPFEVEITDRLDYNSENRVTVLCDNRLSSVSVPQGGVVEAYGDNGKVLLQQYDFDFFNYAGIHRSVHLYTTPKTFIKQLRVESSVDDDGHGHVNFEIILSDHSATSSANVNIYDKNMNLVAAQAVDGSMQGMVIINRVTKWWPYLMSPDYGYLYTIEVKLSTPEEQDVDVYRKKFGVRTLRWTSTEFLINDRPVYLRGFGKHEDSDVGHLLKILRVTLN